MISRRSFLTGLMAIASVAALPPATRHTQAGDGVALKAMAHPVRDANGPPYPSLSTVKHAILEKIGPEDWVLYPPGMHPNDLVQTTHTERGADLSPAITGCAPTLLPRYPSNDGACSAADRMTAGLHNQLVMDGLSAGRLCVARRNLVSTGLRT